MVTIYTLYRDDSGGQMVYPVRGVELGWQGARQARLTADVEGSFGDRVVTIGWGKDWKENVPLKPEKTLYQRIASAVARHFPETKDVTVILYR